MVAVLSSVDAPLAVDSLCSLTVSARFVHAGTVVVAHKSAEGVRTKLSFKVLAAYSLYCDAFMMQLKFYNCHMKHSKI